MSLRVFALVAVCSLSTACVLDRTGQSRPYKMYQSIEANTSRIESTEAATRDMDGRIARMRAEEEAYRKAVAESGANLDGLQTSVMRLRGEVEAMRDELRDRGAQDAQVDFRLVEVEARLDEVVRQLGEAVTALESGALEQQSQPPEKRDVVERPKQPVRSGEPGDAKPVDVKGGDPEKTDPEAADAKAVDTVESKVVDEPSKPGDPVATTIPSKPTGGPDDRAFASALESYRDKDWAKAGRAFAAFGGKYSDSRHAPDAALMGADCQYRLGRYNAAITSFQDVIEEWSATSHAARAMFMQGMCFEALGLPEDAVIFYQEVARIYPDTQDAEAARERILELRGG